MQLKVIQHMLTSTMERLVAEGELIADTRTALTRRYSHFHDIETLLGQKKPSPIIPLTVLFDGLHGNNASGEAFFHSVRLVMRSNNNNCYSKNSIYLNTIKHSAKLMWSYTNNKLNFLTNHNKTNIRILRIYKNKNSTQYIIIIYVAESAETLTRRQSLSQPVPSCAQSAMGRRKARECLSLLTFH